MQSSADNQLARLAGAIAEPARARMLCSLMDGRARTATELAAVAEVAASTASAHLARLREDGLVEVVAQGKHRYVRLSGENVARALEALLLVAGKPAAFKPSTPQPLREARTCYDHMAGRVAVALHDYCVAHRWVGEVHYDISPTGETAFTRLGLDVSTLRQQRRKLACACLDWSERRPHLGGGLGAALLQLAQRQGWVQSALDSRGLSLTRKGVSAFQREFALTFN